MKLTVTTTLGRTESGSNASEILKLELHRQMQFSLGFMAYQPL